MIGNLYTVDVLSLLDEDGLNRLDQWAHQMNGITQDDLAEAYAHRDILARHLKNIDENLSQVSLPLIPYLLPAQKEHLKRRLVRAHYFSSLQLRIDEIEYRWDDVKRQKSKCAHYEKLMQAIDTSLLPPSPSLQLQTLTSNSTKATTWFGAWCLAPMIGNLMIELCSGKTSVIKNFVTEIDRKDIYMGWSRNFISCFFNLLPMGHAMKPELSSTLRDIGGGISMVNVVVVNTALAIECYLVLKNTFAGAWATRATSRPVNPFQQFTTQIRQRRFVLLNWFFLSIMHLAAFLCFSGLLDVWPWGPVFSVGARLIQLVLSYFRYQNDEAAYFKNSERLMNQIMQLNAKEQEFLLRLQNEDDLKKREELSKKYQFIREELDFLVSLHKKSEYEWSLRKEEYFWQSRLSTLFFSGVMMFSFLIIPASIVAPPIGLVIGFVGACICITSVISMSRMRSHMEEEKIRQNILSIHQGQNVKSGFADEQLSYYFNRFISLKDGEQTHESSLQMKQCYLLMLQTVYRSEYESKVIERQKTMMWINMARDVFIPLLAIGLFILIPTPIGIAAVVGFALLCFFAKTLIEKYQPLPPFCDVKFDEEKYKKFLSDPQIENLSSAEISSKSRKERWSVDGRDDFDDFSPDLSSV